MRIAMSWYDRHRPESFQSFTPLGQMLEHRWEQRQQCAAHHRQQRARTVEVAQGVHAPQGSSGGHADEVQRLQADEATQCEGGEGYADSAVHTSRDST